MFSTGGPHDEVVIEVDDEDGRPVCGRYIFQDWFDGASRALSEDDLQTIEDAYGYIFESQR